MHLDHLDMGDGPQGIYAACAFSWEALLPGAQLDSGCTGTIEVDLSGRVLPDGECEDGPDQAVAETVAP